MCCETKARSLLAPAGWLAIDRERARACQTLQFAIGQRFAICMKACMLQSWNARVAQEWTNVRGGRTQRERERARNAARGRAAKAAQSRRSGEEEEQMLVLDALACLRLPCWTSHAGRNVIAEVKVVWASDRQARASKRVNQLRTGRIRPASLLYLCVKLLKPSS